MYLIKVSYNLYKLRMRAGLTQQQLADQSGVGKTTISDIENNKTDPTIQTICLLALALSVKFNDLVDIKIIKK